MAQSHIQILREIFQPWYVKVAAAVTAIPGAVGIYAGFQDQFPALPKLQDMMPTLHFGIMPWWDWLLAWLFITLSVFVFGLFEYVRRTMQAPTTASMAQQNESVHLDLAHLLNVAVELSTLVASERLEKQAPASITPLQGNGLDHRVRRRIQNFINKTQDISGGMTGGQPVFWNAMQQADHEADEELQRRLTQDPSLGSSLNRLRDELRLEKRREAALQFLRNRIDEKKETIANARNNLIERNQLRQNR